MKSADEKKSALCFTKPLDVKWDKAKAKAVVRFVSKFSDGKERGIDARMMYK